MTDTEVQGAEHVTDIDCEVVSQLKRTRSNVLKCKKKTRKPK